MSKALTKKTLAELESEIELGIRAVGKGLLEVHERKLYLKDHDTFEDYCKTRWGFSRPRAYQLIESEKVKARLSTIVDTVPAKEGQIREIAKAPEAKQAAVVAAVLETCEAENREPTAKDFRKEAAKYIPVEVSDEESVIGNEPPEWRDAIDGVDQLRIKTNDLLRAVKNASGPGWEMVAEYGNSLRTDLTNAKALFVGCIPHETCTYCNGVNSDCVGCKGRGWLNAHDYEISPKDKHATKELSNGVGR